MSNPHVRWRLELPLDLEDAVTDWLMTHGATATYREADPPHTFWAYFLPGQVPPDGPFREAFPNVRLLGSEAFADEDWLAKSREGFGRFEVGRHFLVKPLWDAAPVPEGRMALVVNPGLAFGTGGHETTRLCMALIEHLADTRTLCGPILDIGAGTGILALTAALLGGRDILACDNDPDCGPAMDELIALNAHLLGDHIPFRHFIGTLDDPRVQGPYRVLLANILLETIQDLLPRMAELAAPQARLIASGILAERQDEALVSLALEGFRPLRVLREGEWIAILAERA